MKNFKLHSLFRTSFMKRLPSFIVGAGLILSTATIARAQFVVYNNGADVSVSTDCIVSIVTGDLNNAAGTLDNAGRITVEGTVTNGDILTGAGTNTGIFSVSGDWINNGSFTAAQSLVNLNGANQEI
jgi:formylmethanofuran dehydrogenase subunit C